MSLLRFRKTLLLSLMLALSACGGNEDQSEPSGVTLRWTAPSQYDDGSALPDNAVSEYRVYVDQDMVQRVDPQLTEFFLELPEGEWEVTISAVVDGIESRLSDPLAVVVEPEPPADP
jgi:hypothetical protein